MKSLMTCAVSAAALFAVGGATAGAQSMDALIEAAKKEGQLTVIALPRDWCGYGALIDGFKAKYGLTVNELNPNAASADEVEAIKANKGNTSSQAPDVVDLGLAFGPSAKAEGLLAPYKVSTWDEIPADAKDPDGYWYGDYYGVLAFGVNKDVVEKVPADFSDLLTEEYRNQVALSGDPRTAGNGLMAVYAAGLATGGKGGEAAATAGLDFFKKLNEDGNFVPVDAEAAPIAQGTTPIALNWDYNLLTVRDNLKGNPPIEVVIPKSAVVAGVYVQAISAYAPHPNAAKLWMEYLYSDEGQIGWLKGYCHPIRFNAMSKAGKIPADILAKLPDPEAYAKAVFPTLDDQNAAKTKIAADWEKVVGATVK